MTITNAMCSSFKQQLLLAEQDFSLDLYKLALIVATPSGNFGAATTNYSQLGADEVTGTGYTAGGKQVIPTVSLTGTTAIVDFTDISWTSSTITSGGALLYNVSKSNTAVAVFSFGGEQQVTNGTFTIQFPPSGASTSTLRIA